MTEKQRAAVRTVSNSVISAVIISLIATGASIYANQSAFMSRIEKLEYDSRNAQTHINNSQLMLVQIETDVKWIREAISRRP